MQFGEASMCSRMVTTSGKNRLIWHQLSRRPSYGVGARSQVMLTALAGCLGSTVTGWPAAQDLIKQLSRCGLSYIGEERGGVDVKNSDPKL